MDLSQHPRFDRPPATTPDTRPTTPAAFVERLRETVLHGAPRIVFENMAHPPGRRQLTPEQTERQQWLATLSHRERECVEYVAKDAAFVALFGLFCVLDGARAIEPIGPKGHFELCFVRDGVRYPLRLPKMSLVLHDLL